MRVLLLAVALAIAAPAAADPLTLSGTTAPAPTSDDHPHLGIVTGIGFPDGANASLGWRPIRALRFEAGAGYNLIGPGVRGGVTWFVVGHTISPVIEVSGGKFFERDANPFVEAFGHNPSFHSALLEHFGYNFATARAGFELGNKYVAIILRAGISREWGPIHGIESAVMSGSSTSVTAGDAHATAWTASADFGFAAYFY
ncbi:MAG TPA: hypothetical protein VGM88_28760 [Kofleriaceae bacterium]|jgi:hypothetical protein